jgi:hypothetical protein
MSNPGSGQFETDNQSIADLAFSTYAIRMGDEAFREKMSAWSL